MIASIRDAEREWMRARELAAADVPAALDVVIEIGAWYEQVGYRRRAQAVDEAIEQLGRLPPRPGPRAADLTTPSRRAVFAVLDDFQLGPGEFVAHHRFLDSLSGCVPTPP